MVKLYDAETNAPCGTLTDAQFQQLEHALEEESETDADYYLDEDTIDFLETRGVDAAVLAILRAALGERGEMDLRWERVAD